MVYIPAKRGKEQQMLPAIYGTSCSAGRELVAVRFVWTTSYGACPKGRGTSKKMDELYWTRVSLLWGVSNVRS